jgi:hypothetical protein
MLEGIMGHDKIPERHLNLDGHIGLEHEGHRFRRTTYVSEQFKVGQGLHIRIQNIARVHDDGKDEKNRIGLISLESEVHIEHNPAAEFWSYQRDGSLVG